VYISRITQVFNVLKNKMFKFPWKNPARSRSAISSARINTPKSIESPPLNPV